MASDRSDPLCLLKERDKLYIGRLVRTPGHAPIVDLWVLCEALLVYSAENYNDQFGGLLSAIEDVTGSDRRFIVVPEPIHAKVADLVEWFKEDGNGETIGIEAHSGGNMYASGEVQS